jgi:hypothetical protein
MISDDNLRMLRREMIRYGREHGTPTEREARNWFFAVSDPDISPEDAFAPMYDAYFRGSGFDVDTWMLYTENIENIRIEKSVGGGVYVHFDFDFDDGSGDEGYSGSRHGRGRI